jgi:quercetin dioxygenase-like cupin family protein
MKIAASPMQVVDWTRVAPTQHPGETGIATWRTQMMGDIRVRMVEYSPGYRADHWCAKGHVILCLEGQMDIQLTDGKHLTMQAGESYQVGDGEPGHRTYTAGGVKLFIVD